ncbi:MAG: N-acetylneuraminate synthase family protein, partial [Thermoplasmata archaeon]|nr:N-acetylneuraminate synthase family protein [Thermoplasmata archaeon]
DINLSKMMKIKDICGLPVGYADHTAYDDPHNEMVSVMAASLGVPILEKHYTPEHGVERIDFHAAVGREKMLIIKKLMKLAFEVYGSGRMTMSEPEKKYGNVGPMKKAIVARVPIKAGETLTSDKLWFKRTEEESTLKQNQFLLLVGQKAQINIEADEIIDFSKVDYKFKKLDLDEFTHVKKVEKGK